MRKTSLILAVFLVMSTLASAKSYERSKPAGPYTVTIVMDKYQPRAGWSDEVSILIKDETGKAVTDAGVTLDYSRTNIPGIPNLPPIRHLTPATINGQTYTAKVDFSIPGFWEMKVNIKSGNDSYGAIFTTEVL